MPYITSTFRQLITTGSMIFLSAVLATAQGITQTIRGRVVEKESQFPLPGATVLLVSDTTTLKGATTDTEGTFTIQEVPVGRQTLKVSFIGYEDAVMNNIIVSSAKEVVLLVSLNESAVQLADVVVTASRDGDASNEMALVSARSFTIEETERYAGSRGDPARMASNFAGVQGADDSRNDIVIRGNSPQAVLWRMEGINIPNPNHFNISGTAGGPVSMINNKTLSNSDFYTGAFPAEFGNSIAGVFDLKLRNGNNKKHEFSGQFGFLGTEIFGEGPLSKSGQSSYLFSYRYSTLAVFSELGIDIGTTAVPRYQDMAFKLNFPLKNNGSLSLFGLGGNSHIDILISEQKVPERNLYGSNDRDQYFGSAAGIVGMSYKQPINTSSYFTATAAFSTEIVDAQHDYIYRHLDTNNQYVVDDLEPVLDYLFKQSKLSGNIFYAKKLKERSTFNVGLNSDLYFFNFNDSVRNVTPSGLDPWRLRWNTSEQSLLLQPFVQWKKSFSDKTEMMAGLHSQYFSLSNSFIPLEPRIGFKHKPNSRNTFDFGVGLHSQIQPGYIYFQGQKTDDPLNPQPVNRNLDFTRSFQSVFGFQRMMAENIRVKSEVYYQYLFNIPVENRPTSSFSLVNTGAGFSRFFPEPLVNKGVGKNYGVELTVEKFFSRGYLFLITSSLFEAKYKGYDGIWRDTDFNGNYIFNSLFTKEWKLKGRNTIALGGKLTTAGGRRYGPVDQTASDLEKDIVYLDAQRNSKQFAPYFRADLRINYKINRPKVTHEIALDLVNLLGTKNILKLTYAPDPLNLQSPIREEYQLGFLPLFYYRIDF
jgi:CarboxypepD_reg-like domain/TonB-dependent Receptor Plug Domain